jgi:pimeloyl-ACP methyl ester carboxylesterase
MIQEALSSLTWKQMFVTYLCTELSFYACYRYVFLPKAQIRKVPRPYRDYPDPGDRAKLLQRIIHRLERQHSGGDDLHTKLSNFVLAWFKPADQLQQRQLSAPLPLLKAVSTLESSNLAETSDDDDDEQCDSMPAATKKFKTIAGLKKEELDEFFAWAFFGKDMTDMEPTEMLELAVMYSMLEEKCHLRFEPGRGGKLEGRRLTLENVKPLHRPLLVYIIVHFIERIGNIFLRLYGFRRHSSPSGLIYWHRLGLDTANRLPLLFFHGIVPAGKTFYLPICLASFGDRKRTMYLFENPPIGGCITFEALSEDETVDGVQYALSKHDDSNRPLTLVGHSFGSCPMTWLLHSSLKKRISQFVLIDPVTILLSEPDVMVNFVYSRHECQPNGEQAGMDKIQLVAGSELFTEYYLRRNFSWYNSELWMDEIGDHTQVLVCLSEEDTVLHAPNVKREVEAHYRNDKSMELIYWKGVDHADCITNRDSWRQIRTAMLAQERRVLAEELLKED